MIRSSDDSPHPRDTDRDQESARFLFWPVLVSGLILGLLTLTVDELRFLGHVALFCLLVAVAMLVRSGRMNNWNRSTRMATVVLAVTSILILGAWGRALGWF